MTDRYELVETKYDGEREVHISNVSWVMANALKDILEDKCVGRLIVKEMFDEEAFWNDKPKGYGLMRR